MSAYGTKRTSRRTQPMSAFGGKADIARHEVRGLGKCKNFANGKRIVAQTHNHSA
jgi:hypothetical protein